MKLDYSVVKPLDLPVKSALWFGNGGQKLSVAVALHEPCLRILSCMPSTRFCVQQSWLSLTPTWVVFAANPNSVGASEVRGCGEEESEAGKRRSEERQGHQPRHLRQLPGGGRPAVLRPLSGCISLTVLVRSKGGNKLQQ